MTIDTIFRLLPAELKGKQQVARLLLKQAIEQSKNIEIKTEEGIFKVPNLKESVSFSLYIDGIFEPEVVNFIAKHTAKSRNFLDIGANIGSITIPVLRRNPQLTAYCIEASPRIFNYLKYNQEKNYANRMHVFNLAVTEQSAEQLSFFSPEEGFGRGSLSPVFTKEAEIVTGYSLDDLLLQAKFPQPDFIKIDIEGYEKQAFVGGKNLLSAAQAPDILFEFCDWAEELAHNQKGDAQRVLLEYGYNVYELKNHRLHHLSQILENGFAMIYATKKS